MSKLIVVNNPAAKEGGVLTILKQFLENISKYDKENNYLIFVCLEELRVYEKENIKIIVIPKQDFRQRILWDNFGLKKYLKKNRIRLELLISFQNTAVNIDKTIPQIIYYHQSLSLSNKKWNLLKKEERLFWMYKNIYPFFIKQYLNKVKKVVVQTEWIKEEFAKKFKYSKKNLEIIKPEFKLPNIDEVEYKKENKKIQLFYPAAPYIYKNHEVIVEALNILKEKNEKLLKNIECIFTFSKDDGFKIYDLIKKYKLEDQIKLIGKIPYNQVLQYYKSCDLVLFPSYIETFGLPLIEAASFGKTIIASDCSYGREVIEKYKGVEFLDYSNSKIWAKEIENKALNKINYDKFKVGYNTSWKNFFEIIIGEIKC